MDERRGSRRERERERKEYYFTRDTRAMICAEHDAHFDEAGGVFWELAFEPEQADDVSHIEISCDESAHCHPIISWLFTPVITYCAHHICWHSHLHIINIVQGKRGNEIE